MSRYAGVEQTVFFAMDEPEALEETVASINVAHRQVFQQLVEGPSEVLFVSDNLSTDVQSPPWFRKYSAAHYKCMADTAHAHGKPLASHIDGRLRGLLALSAELGVDAADAVTPAPWGDLTPQECRDEAGDRLVLSGAAFRPIFSTHQFHWKPSTVAWKPGWLWRIAALHSSSPRGINFRLTGSLTA